MSVTFDGVNKLITCTAGTTSLDVQVDVYSAWKDWTLSGDNAKFLQAISYVGGDPINPQLSLGSTYFLENGWRIRPDEANHTLEVLGNIYTREGSVPYVQTLSAYNVMIINRVSNLIDQTSMADLANTVWDEQLVGHSTVGSAGKALQNASSAGDPWSTELPGGYTGIQAGKLLSEIQPSLSSQNTAIANQITDVSNQIAGISGQNILISGQVLGISGQNLTMSDQIIGISNQINGISGQNIIISGQVIGISGQNILISGQVTGIANQNTTILGEVSGITYQLSGISQQLTTITDDLTGFTDPWAVDLPGLYTGAQAGRIIGEIETTLTEAISAIPDPLTTANGIEANITLKQALQVILAVISGRASGGGTTNIKFKDPTGVVDRVDMTVDGSGNRSNVDIHT